MIEALAIGDSRWKNINTVNIDELINGVDSFSFAKFVINPTLNVNNRVNWHFTDKDHPIVVGDILFLGNILGVEEEYYQENKARFDEIFLILAARVNSTSFTLTGDFITPEMIRAVAKNPNIKKIYLGERDEGHILTKEEYEILSNSSIESIVTPGIVPELEGIFGRKIDYNDSKRLIGYDCYEDLIKKDSFSFSEPLSDETIKNLQYVKDDGIKISFSGFDDFENMFKVIDRLESLGKKYSCQITVQSKNNYDYKNEFNNFIFSHAKYLDNDKITIGVGILETYPLVDYVKYEKRLIEMIKPAINMSPFEKYLFAYNIVKKYKEYKENENEKDQSRNLYSILDGEYMVCVGYATLLNDLLTKLGISSCHYSVGVDTGFDKVDKEALVIPDDIEVNREGHARVKVHIVDPKYGIDGIYFADPTWDNDMEKDTYNFAAMTPSEYNGLYRYNFLDFYNVDELFFVNSLEEFYQKANIWIDKNIESSSRLGQNYAEKNLEEFKKAASDIVVMLKEHAPEKIEFINMVYANIFRMKIAASNIPRFVDRIGEIVKTVDDPLIKDKFRELSSKKDSILYNKKTKKERGVRSITDFMRGMLEEIRKLDPQKYAVLTEKYPELQQYGFTPDEKFIGDFMYEVGDYVVNKTQTEIRGEQFKDAIREVYKRTKDLTPEQLEKELDEVMAYNMRRQRLAFPVRYKVMEDGRKIPILNEVNKFEISEGETLST